MSGIMQMVLAGDGGGSIITPFVVATGNPQHAVIGTNSTLTLNTDGTITLGSTTGSNTGGTFQTQWATATPGSTFYARGKYSSLVGPGTISGDLQGGSSGTWGAWFALTSDRYVRLVSSIGNTAICSIDMEISADGSTTLYTAAQFALANTR